MSLPNMSAYNETCAAIGNVYVNYRLFLLHGQSKYYDVLERTLYNGLIDGVSMDGGGFFYPNPLESMGQHQRQAWFGCACCPSNICRFLPSLPGYVYAVKDRNVFVNLFLSNSASLEVAGRKVAFSQTTRYPWDGDIAIKVNGNAAGRFGMKIRIPGWVKGQPVPSDLYYYTDGKRLGYTITVNGQPTDGQLTDDGYFTITRKWKKGDVVRVHFDMEVRTVRANNKVVADRGQISIERGPIVYAAEWPDNNFNIMNVLMNRQPVFTPGSAPYAAFIADSLKHRLTQYKDLAVETLTTPAQTLAYTKDGRLSTQDVSLKAHSLLCLGPSRQRQHEGMAAAGCLGRPSGRSRHAGFHGKGGVLLKGARTYEHHRRPRACRRERPLHPLLPLVAEEELH